MKMDIVVNGVMTLTGLGKVPTMNVLSFFQGYESNA